MLLYMLLDTTAYYWIPPHTAIYTDIFQLYAIIYTAFNSAFIYYTTYPTASYEFLPFYDHLGKTTECCTVYEKAYSLLKTKLSPTDPELQELIRDLLNTLVILKSYKRAHEIALLNYNNLKADKSVVLSVEVVGSNEVGLGGVVADLGLAGLKQAQIEMHLEGFDLNKSYLLLEESLTHCEVGFGSSSLQVAEVLVSMAHIRKKQSLFDELTMALLNRAHNCYEATVGPDDPNTLFTLKTIQKVRREQYLQMLGSDGSTSGEK
jgi:hypothetical protein